MTITVYLTKPYQALKLRTDKSTSTRNKLSHKANNFAPGNHDFIAVVFSSMQLATRNKRAPH